MQSRTDLALEKHEQIGEQGRVPGVEVRTWTAGETRVTRILVRTADAARTLGKPAGSYYTVETEGFPDAFCLDDGTRRTLTKILLRLLPKQGPVLVAGLGNPQVTPDALGPRCAAQIFATRHIPEQTRRELSLPPLREVSAVAPGVTGQTGVEAAEAIDAICKKVRPAAVIAVDALAAANVRRLSRTVQISDVGVEPGSGVGNARKALSRETLGVPVIAVGVPTVVDAASLAHDVLGAYEDCAEAPGEYAEMMVTPRDTDVITASAARFIALAVNCVLQKELTREEIAALM